MFKFICKFWFVIRSNVHDAAGGARLRAGDARDAAAEELADCLPLVSLRLPG